MSYPQKPEFIDCPPSCNELRCEELCVFTTVRQLTPWDAYFGSNSTYIQHFRILLKVVQESKATVMSKIDNTDAEIDRLGSDSCFNSNWFGLVHWLYFFPCVSLRLQFFHCSVMEFRVSREELFEHLSNSSIARSDRDSFVQYVVDDGFQKLNLVTADVFFETVESVKKMVATFHKQFNYKWKRYCRSGSKIKERDLNFLTGVISETIACSDQQDRLGVQDRRRKAFKALRSDRSTQ